MPDWHGSLLTKGNLLHQSIGTHLENLPGYSWQCIHDLLAHADQLDARVADYDKAIAQAAPDGNTPALDPSPPAHF